VEPWRGRKAEAVGGNRETESSLRTPYRAGFARPAAYGRYLGPCWSSKEPNAQPARSRSTTIDLSQQSGVERLGPINDLGSVRACAAGPRPRRRSTGAVKHLVSGLPRRAEASDT